MWNRFVLTNLLSSINIFFNFERIVCLSLLLQNDLKKLCAQCIYFLQTIIFTTLVEKCCLRWSMLFYLASWALRSCWVWNSVKALTALWQGVWVLVRMTLCLKHYNTFTLSIYIGAPWFIYIYLSTKNKRFSYFKYFLKKLLCFCFNFLIYTLM